MSEQIYKDILWILIMTVIFVIVLPNRFKNRWKAVIGYLMIFTVAKLLVIFIDLF